jgi:pimeloyl-ACP methyl ester carboxylesterase
MKLKYKNAEIFYSVKGTGNPMVLLHGFLESSKIWDPLIYELSKKRKIVTIDLPGHGISGLISKVHSMELMADVVHNVLKDLGIETATICGHSMGGYVALAFCESFPKMTKGLILMNSTTEEDSEERKINRDRAVDLVQSNKKAFVSMAISNLLTPENNKKFRTEIEELKDAALKFPIEGIVAALKGMKIRTNKKDVLKEFKGYKLIISGAKDPVLDSETLKNIALSCNSDFKSLSGGHLSFLTNFPEICQMMYFIDYF